MRGVVFGLLFSNLVYLAWNLFVPAPSVPAVPEFAAQSAQDVQLLSEVSSERLIRYPATDLTPTQELLASDDTPLQTQALYCAEIGPFRGADDAQNFATTYAQRMSLVVEIRQVPAAPDYRVFLPPFASKELATSTQEILRAAFVANNLTIDTYLVPRGELENAIALGLFSEQSNALNVQRQMQGLGYQVVVRAEEKQASEAWVFAVGIDSAAAFAQQWSQMRLSRSYIDAGEKLCETIAHAPQFP